MPQPPKSGDTLILELPFFDDFSNYTGLPDSKRWLTFDAFVNQDYAPYPPTVGVVTLDALNANGDLYPQATTSLFPADTLASQIIRLDSITGSSARALQVSDSISLSFYYLPGGWYGNAWERVGDTPAERDSLFLDFYDHHTDTWSTVWCTPGFNADTAGITSHWPWKYAYIKIDSSKYLSKRFQFRFRNYASLDVNPKSGIAGNCDQWNIDYILLGYNRSIGDSMPRDIAFVSKAPSLLSNYQAMPSRQFRTNEMKSDINLTIVNRYNQTLASTYSYTVTDQNNNTIEQYNGGYENIAPFYPSGQYQTAQLHANPPVNFSYPTSPSEKSFRITHVVSEGVGGDIHTCNDTITFTQVLSNYFAYDDGTPENGYGLTAAGNHQWLAYLFVLNQPDTLTAVNMFFNRTRNAENEDIVFNLCIWKCRNGKPSELIYKDPTIQMPQFEGLNRYHRYILTDPQILDDSVFIGFEQLGNKYINIGFDRSNNASQRLYYLTGSEWEQSFLSGAVMLRPAFGTSALADIHNSPLSDNINAKIYPCPASNILHIQLQNGNPQHYTLEITDILGRIVVRQPYCETIQLDNIPDGLYIIRLRNIQTAQQHLQKIIIRK